MFDEIEKLTRTNKIEGLTKNMVGWENEGENINQNINPVTGEYMGNP